ncbi:unnamed protein product [Arabidopsis arenosa]|uniref:Uncharacterized protein n=1 Tax=Arabidopsis arenosa TaxID=38785 RepID=A0A8S1ZJU3_ARAAE|nr:unnamed protein product [Arabidopsis arenosa]
MSDRNGLGPHKHVSGPKSYTYKSNKRWTHSKKDGTFVDRKAHEVHEAFKKNKATKLAAFKNDESSDGTSHRSELSQEEDDEIFLQLLSQKTEKKYLELEA